MRILQVIPYFARSMGGPVMATHRLSRELVKRGFEVEILTTNFRLDDEFVKQVRGDGIGVTLATCDMALGLFLLSPSMKLWLRTRGRDFDIIHMHEFRSYQNSIVRAFASKHHIPYVLQAHGSVIPFLEKKTLKKVYDLVWGSNLLEDASILIALNEMEKEQYVFMGVAPNQITVIPNGIDSSEFHTLPEIGRFREKYGIGPTERVVLYLGRIHRIKGLDVLVSAFAEVAKEVDNARLVIVGPDDGFLARVKKSIRELRLENRTLFTGPLYGIDKLEAYVDSNVFVLPSRYDMFPNSVLEAMACGTPIIVSDRCGIKDKLGGAGLVFRFDSEQLKLALLRVLNDEELRMRQGEEGMRIVGQDFALGPIARLVETTYMDAIARAERRVT